MRIKNLKLENIGPFKNATLEFISDDDEIDTPPVICITGENGTGKSIILDAIRSILAGRYNEVLERDIVSSQDFFIEGTFYINNKYVSLNATKKYQKTNSIDTTDDEVNKLFNKHLKSAFKKDFVFDYWTSKLSSDSFKINNISTLNVEDYLEDTLKGIHKNIKLTEIMSFLDYLKGSTNSEEKELGSKLYSILEDIINISIFEGKLSHVSRTSLTPIIKVGTRELTLDKLSSGNLYLIQRLVNLLGQIYSICIINNIPISEYKSISGLVLIDEAENHLHPKWQKVFLKNILKVFPKLQLIVSTHSPFIVSSVENSRVFVCSGELDHSFVKEETDYYSNKPIEEILLSPLFNTNNFNYYISDLIMKRKLALQENNIEQVKVIETELLNINPDYFNYFEIDKLIKTLKG